MFRLNLISNAKFCLSDNLYLPKDKILAILKHSKAAKNNSSQWEMEQLISLRPKKSFLDLVSLKYLNLTVVPKKGLLSDKDISCWQTLSES